MNYRNAFLLFPKKIKSHKIFSEIGREENKAIYLTKMFQLSA